MLLGEDLELAGGDAHVRADDDQAAGLGRGVAGVGFRAGEFGADLLADAGAHERRAHAVEELLAAAFGLFQAQGQGAQIVLGDDVRHDRGGVRGGVDGVGDGFGGDVRHPRCERRRG